VTALSTKLGRDTVLMAHEYVEMLLLDRDAALADQGQNRHARAYLTACICYSVSEIQLPHKIVNYMF